MIRARLDRIHAGLCGAAGSLITQLVRGKLSPLLLRTAEQQIASAHQELQALLKEVEKNGNGPK